MSVDAIFWSLFDNSEKSENFSIRFMIGRKMI